MLRMLAASKPLSANSARAASRMAVRVDCARCCSARFLGAAVLPALAARPDVAAEVLLVAMARDAITPGFGHGELHGSPASAGSASRASPARGFLPSFAFDIAVVFSRLQRARARPKSYVIVEMPSRRTGCTTSEGLTPKTASLSRYLSPFRK